MPDAALIAVHAPAEAPPAPKLSPLQEAILPILDQRGMLGKWMVADHRIVLKLKMAESRLPSTVYVTFAHPADLSGFHVIGWRSGTMEELKIARPVIWELCKITGDEAQIEKHRAYWRDTTPMDWDGRPGPEVPPPGPIAPTPDTMSA